MHVFSNPKKYRSNETAGIRASNGLQFQYTMDEDKSFGCNALNWVNLQRIEKQPFGWSVQFDWFNFLCTSHLDQEIKAFFSFCDEVAIYSNFNCVYNNCELSSV